MTNDPRNFVSSKSTWGSKLERSQIATQLLGLIDESCEGRCKVYCSSNICAFHFNEEDLLSLGQLFKLFIFDRLWQTVSEGVEGGL